MLDHISLGTTDLKRAEDFYTAVLATLGYQPMHKADFGVGYGSKYPQFWIGLAIDGGTPRSAPGTHICFKASSREAVQAFYKTAIAQGGRDAGAPGLRPQYSGQYYAAFVYDLDGHKIEAVTFAQ